MDGGEFRIRHFVESLQDIEGEDAGESFERLLRGDNIRRNLLNRAGILERAGSADPLCDDGRLRGDRKWLHIPHAYLRDFAKDLLGTTGSIRLFGCNGIRQPPQDSALTGHYGPWNSYSLVLPEPLRFSLDRRDRHIFGQVKYQRDTAGILHPTIIRCVHAAVLRCASERKISFANLQVDVLHRYLNLRIAVVRAWRCRSEGRLTNRFRPGLRYDFAIDFNRPGKHKVDCPGGARDVRAQIFDRNQCDGRAFAQNRSRLRRTLHNVSRELWVNELLQQMVRRSECEAEQNVMKEPQPVARGIRVVKPRDFARGQISDHV